jgi:anti-sigma regulatory factor (Ser/Thr protein kinase)
VVLEQTYLAELGRILNSSLQLDRTLRHICEAAVPLLAHSCQIDLLTDGVIRTAAFAYTGTQIEVPASRIRAQFSDGARATKLTESAGGVTLETTVVPLRLRDKTFGAISFVRPLQADAYGSSDLTFLEEIGRRCALAITNAQVYQREHRVATALQAVSLPRRLPHIDGIAMDAVYVPGRSEAQIGGDWYDAFSLTDGRIVVSIGDVAGSGLDAAVTMGSMRQIIRGIAQVHANPVLMLDSADRALRMEDHDRFVTAFAGVIDPIASTMTYATAGHPPPFLRRKNGELIVLDAVDLPLGLRERGGGNAHSVDVYDGDLLVLYTDGLVESGRDLQAGLAQLQDALMEPALDDVARPALFLQERMLPGGAHDDVAVLTLRLQPEERLSAMRRWHFQSHDPEAFARVRGELRTALQNDGFSALSLETAELVLGELGGNVVRHAAGPVDLVLDHTNGEYVLHVIDEGPGFERMPMLPSDVMSESGRGLFIVSQLTREFSVTKRHPRGSHARAVLAR